MRALLYISAAVIAYLVAGWNPAITFSKAIYKKDIRECGSGNPGFTNFKRTFGNRFAWLVLVLDLSKAAIVAAIFACLFARHFNAYYFGAAYTGFFAMLGHAFPIWYKFKGGKGFLVSLSTVWVIDWRVGLIATIIMIVLLLTTKFMSLSTVAAMLCCPVLLAVFKVPASAVLVMTAIVLFMTVRHKENFKRLKAGNEPKFTIK
jgi:glycerol-3-phosphate acyltransferase PlsY